MRILFAEDEKALSKVIIKIFKKNDYLVDAVYNGIDALQRLHTGKYDVAVLDIMMPQMDGVTVLKEIRAQGNLIPVLLLTAKSGVEDKVAGLDSGADYYLTKPFDSKELLATIRAITRNQSVNNSKITFGNITLDRATFEISSDFGSFQLTNKEFQMMEMLLLNPNHVITLERFCEKIWGYDLTTDKNIVWIYTEYVKNKLLALHADIKIRTMGNVGCILEKSND